MASELTRLLSHLKGEITKAKKSGWIFQNDIDVENLLNYVDTSDRTPQEIVEDIRNLVYEQGYYESEGSHISATSREEYKDIKRQQQNARKRVKRAVARGETPEEFDVEIAGYTPQEYYYDEDSEYDTAPDLAGLILEKFQDKLLGMDYEKTADGLWRPSIQRGKNKSEAQGKFVESIDVLVDIMNEGGWDAEYIINHESEISEAIDQLESDRYDYQIQATFSRIAYLLNGGKDLNENMNEALTQAVSNDVGYMPVE